jgi:hypothetical protein
MLSLDGLLCYAADNGFQRLCQRLMPLRLHVKFVFIAGSGHRGCIEIVPSILPCLGLVSLAVPPPR